MFVGVDLLNKLEEVLNAHFLDSDKLRTGYVNQCYERLVTGEDRGSLLWLLRYRFHVLGMDRRLLFHRLDPQLLLLFFFLLKIFNLTLSVLPERAIIDIFIAWRWVRLRMNLRRLQVYGGYVCTV